MKHSFTAELLLNAILEASPSTATGKLRRYVFSAIRRVAANNGDPLVRYRLDGSELLLPLSHDLPVYRKLSAEYSENTGRVALCVWQKYPDCHFIDIGANVGDTVAIVRSQCPCPVLAIEGDERYFKILEHNLRHAGFSGVTACRAFVGSSQDTLAGTLVSKDGSARFVKNAGGNVASMRLSDLLPRYPQFMTARILKIDTDGFDCTILHSEIDWLAGSRPVIFFEYDPYLTQEHGYDAQQVFADMRAIGYRTALFWDNNGDYLVTLALDRDSALIQELHGYYTGLRGARYADVALIHSEDDDLAAAIRAGEVNHFAKFRNGGGAL